MKKILFALCVICASCSPKGQELTILHMNDTHSHIDPQRSGEDMGRGGVIEQAAYIEEVREEEGKDNVLLLHAGDFGQGTSYFTELGGDIEIDVLNAMEFDAVCLGNHEFDNGFDELSRRLKNLDVPVVCANYDFAGTPMEGLVKPYTTVRRAGMKIGILGVLTDIMEVVDRDIAKNLTYQDPVSVVNELAAYLADDEKCDFVICLSHLGYDEDIDLASKIANVDVIVGGHSHTWIDEMEVVKDLEGEDVAIVQDWKFGMSIGHLTIEF